jgi:hypothetical protein
MQILKEITNWEVDYRQPNHIYLIDSDKVVAYQKWGEGDVTYLSRPLRLDRRGRKFVEIKSNAFIINEVKSKLITITGSKGDTYQVDPDTGTCTCPGFTFRNTSKHIKAYV